MILKIWAFPQTIIGWIYHKIQKKNIIYTWNYDSNTQIHVLKEGAIKKGDGVSFGSHVFIEYDRLIGRKMFVVRHELGHSVQSKMWGPLYLFAIGIPSALLNIRNVDNYHSHYPEKQANQIGKKLFSQSLIWIAYDVDNIYYYARNDRWMNGYSNKDLKAAFEKYKYPERITNDI